MDSIEALAGIAQLSLALVGFAGLAAVFVRPKDGRLPPVASLRLRLLIEQGFFTMFAALFPIPLLLIAMPNAWRIASAVLAVAILLFSAFQNWRVKVVDLGGETIGTVRTGYIFMIVTWIAAATLLVGALGLWPGVEPAVYVASGLAGLFFPAYNFINLVTRDGDLVQQIKHQKHKKPRSG